MFPSKTDFICVVLYKYKQTQQPILLYTNTIIICCTIISYSCVVNNNKISSITKKYSIIINSYSKYNMCTVFFLRHIDKPVMETMLWMSVVFFFSYRSKISLIIDK